MSHIVFFNLLVMMSKAERLHQSHIITIFVFVLALIWLGMMLWITHLSDLMYINGSVSDMHPKSTKSSTHKKQDKKSNSKSEDSDSKIVEPYDTKAFREQPLNFDIEGFWDSYTHRHDK